jgi:hypothetical protein
MPTRSINITDVEQKALLGGEVPPSLLKKIVTAQKPKSARYGKNKGAQFQKDCADFIAELFGLPWDNTDDHSPIKTRPMGSAGTDLIMQEPLYSMFRYDVECKNVESLSVPATVEQATSNTKTGRDWLIMWKRKSFKEPIIIMAQSAFAKLFKEAT